MNIYDYLNSPDIAAYCEKIGHVFNPLEMAVIVELSNKTMKQKHVAWREIISKYPDMPIHQSFNFDARNSLHEFLQELIKQEEKLKEDFYTKSENVMYVPCIWRHGDERNDMGQYSTAEKARKAISEYWDWEKDGIEYANIYKKRIDEKPCLVAQLNVNGELIQLYDQNPSENPDENPNDLGLIFIHFPVLFEKGDVVTFDGIKPYVLKDLPHWWTIIPYEKFVSGERGDGSDNCAEVYYIDEDGSLKSDYGPPYVVYELQYFRKELQGQERFLKYIGQYMKKNDDAIDWLINVFCKFKAEAECERVNGLFGGWYRSLAEEC